MLFFYHFKMHTSTNLDGWIFAFQSLFRINPSLLHNDFILRLINKPRREIALINKHKRPTIVVSSAVQNHFVSALDFVISLFSNADNSNWFVGPATNAPTHERHTVGRWPQQTKKNAAGVQWNALFLVLICNIWPATLLAHRNTSLSVSSRSFAKGEGGRFFFCSVLFIHRLFGPPVDRPLARAAPSLFLSVHIVLCSLHPHCFPVHLFRTCTALHHCQCSPWPAFVERRPFKCEQPARAIFHTSIYLFFQHMYITKMAQKNVMYLRHLARALFLNPHFLIHFCLLQ